MSLMDTDPELYRILEKERIRQSKGLHLIASENFTSSSVREALSSHILHKYSEGYPGARYYSGNEFVDENERLCQERALKAFHLDPSLWGVNVQALSGSPANFSVYTALLEPGDRIMGLHLTHGGHLTHGYQSEKKKVSSSSIYFTSMPYQMDANYQDIDYDALAANSKLFFPKLIIAGSSAYPRYFDYERMQKIAHGCGAYLLADISHISGLVAAQVIPNPFTYSDLVTTTTHKTLRGPRGALIFYRKKSPNGTSTLQYDKLESRINFGVFPACHGGPHNHTIASISVALREATTDQFIKYQRNVLTNAKILSEHLIQLGYRLVTNGTDIHLMVVDLRPQAIDGARVQIVAELATIYTNKNTIPGDESSLIPFGIRLGTPAMTTRGFQAKEFKQVAHLFHDAVEIAKHWQKECQDEGKTKLIQFEEKMRSANCPRIQALKEKIEVLCNALETDL